MLHQKFSFFLNTKRLLFKAGPDAHTELSTDIQAFGEANNRKLASETPEAKANEAARQAIEAVRQKADALRNSPDPRRQQWGEQLYKMLTDNGKLIDRIDKKGDLSKSFAESVQGQFVASLERIARREKTAAPPPEFEIRNDMPDLTKTGNNTAVILEKDDQKPTAAAAPKDDFKIANEMPGLTDTEIIAGKVL